MEKEGVVKGKSVELSNKVIGARLCDKLNLNLSICPEDNKIYEQMLKHQFITLTLLGLPQWAEEEDLILQYALLSLSKLKTPQSPN
jgi:hypothetical protein